MKRAVLSDGAFELWKREWTLTKGAQPSEENFSVKGVITKEKDQPYVFTEDPPSDRVWTLEDKKK